MSESNSTTSTTILPICECTTDTARTILSVEDLHIFQIVNHMLVSGTVCLLGSIANVINMIIFSKQGLQDTVNLCLFALSLSDLFSLVTLQWVNINLNPFMERADLPFEPRDVQYFTGGWPHACFARITIWITIVVTAERFCCVAFPLKVKQMATRGRTKVVICVIYVAMFATLSPVYVCKYFGEKFVPARNETRVGLIDRDNKQYLDFLAFQLYAIIGIAIFVILIVITSMLIISLQHRAARRRTLTNHSQQENNTTTRDRRTMKLVSLVAILVIICFTPSITAYFTTFFVPGFSLTGRHSTMFNALWSITFLAEAVNSSVNIFIFYRMSSRYRHTFHQLFSVCQTYCRGRDTIANS